MRFIYTHNPFYAISAALVFWGLRASFDTTGPEFQTWSLSLSLIGYTSLLAVTAVLVIRLGNVWEDARTLLLLVLLMFLALATTFDDCLAGNPTTGAYYYFVGWIFAAGLSEVLLRGVRIRLPILFRLPYHLLLAILFLYPLLLKNHVQQPGSGFLQWGLFGFATAIGFALLTLLPAVWSGPAYTRKNGTPWSWPWFPWTPFVVLGAAACLRAYYLCVALHFVPGRATIFSLWFLVPILLSADLLLLEIGRSLRSGRIIRMALLLPAVILALAIEPAHLPPLKVHFQLIFMNMMGASPFYWTLVGVILLYTFAVLVHVRGAVEALTCAFVVLATTSPAGRGPFTAMPPAAPLLASAAALQLWIGLRKQSSARVFAASLLGIAAALAHLPGPWSTAAGYFLPWNIVLASVLLIGATFGDRMALVLRRAGSALIVMSAVWALVNTREPALLPLWLAAAYCLVLTVIGAAYGYVFGMSAYYAAAALSLAMLMLDMSWRGYTQLRGQIVGLTQLAWGALFFLMAALISVLKAGLGHRQETE